MGKKISVANLVATAGGIVCVLFSFFGFFDYGSESYSAWSDEGGMWVTTVPAILAIVFVAWSLCELFGVKLPANVLTFNSNQLKATWAISAAGLMLDFLVSFDQDKALGFWFMFIGSVAMAVGAVMALLGKGTEMVSLGGGAKPAAAPSPPYGAAPPYAAAPPPPPPGAVPPPPPPPPPPAG